MSEVTVYEDHDDGFDRSAANDRLVPSNIWAIRTELFRKNKPSPLSRPGGPSSASIKYWWRLDGWPLPKEPT